MKSFAVGVFGQERTIGLLVILLIFAGLSKPANADTTWTYSGPPFSAAECEKVYPQCAAGGKITGSFTISAPVPATGTKTITTNQITSWTMSAGPLGTVSSGGSGSALTAEINFSDGTPKSWLLWATSTGSTPDSLETYWDVSSGWDEAVLGFFDSPSSTLGVVLTPPPGTWNGAPTPVAANTAKTLGNGSDAYHTGSIVCGHPCDVGTGNEYESVTDYTTSGQNPLGFTRYYNSLASNTDPYATELGSRWRSNYDRYLTISPAGPVTIYRADGQVLLFDGTMNTSSDIDIELASASPTWYLTDHDGTVETYTQLSSGEALLQKIVTRDGYTQTLSYNAGNQLQKVTDSYGRTLTFTYNSAGLLTQVTTPGALVLTYGYTSSGVTPGVDDQLASVAYNTTPATKQVYSYVNNFDLASITDEDGNVFANWTYDNQNRALTSQYAGGADLVTIAYNDTNDSRAVTNALGQQTGYNFATLQEVPKITNISRTASATVPAATESFTYDANGYTASKTDWNGDVTNYINDIHGDPTSITEAAGTAQARTTTITYAGTLPTTMVAPRKTTMFTYDANGNPLTRTETDTSGGSTNGQTRTWHFTYDSTGHMLTATNPLGAVTTYTYSGNNIATVTDALGHVSKITAYNASGQPLSMTDPNGVVTTLTYDTRNRLLSRTIDGATTSFAYDAAGNLITITLPDNAQLDYTYDAAHRVIAVNNNVGEHINYTLDADGDITQQQIVGTTIARTQSAVFDSLGRMLKQIGAYNETTAFGYDSDGNTLTTTDALNNTTTQSFDALNRLIKSIDPLHNATAYGFDPQDNLTSVTDPRTLTTSYVYDGFKEVISQTSPDTGTTTYTLDAMGNRISETDARGVITNRTFDKLNRVLTEKYPPTTNEDVTYTYDEGTFGIGRLTSFKDQSGSTAFTYNERGDIVTDTRKIDGRSYDTSYTYDLADHVASITYPSGDTVSYTRDAFGRISAVALQRHDDGHNDRDCFRHGFGQDGFNDSGTLASNVTYEPFGPVKGFTFGNGLAASFTYDLDYRLTNILAKGKQTLQSQTLVYDPVNDIKSIADNEQAQLNQTFTYDADYRLLTAAGKYGNEGFSYDADGNRASEKENTRTSDYTYPATSNHLESTADQSYTYDANGNTTISGDIKYTYNARNRLSAVDVHDGQGFGHVSYFYNALGERVRKEHDNHWSFFNDGGGTNFIYDEQGHTIAETGDNGSAGKEYVYMNSLLIAVLDGNEVYYVHTDQLGTPQKMTDSEQQVIWSRIAEPFGETTRITGPAMLNIRFPGQYFDSESGLNQNFFRTYDPNKGRYTQSDPIGLVAGINTYGYVGQNPLRWIDPSGLSLENTNAPVSISPQLPTPQISSPQSSGSECTVNGNQNNVSPDDQIAANGGIYKNIGPGFLPIQPPGYYTEVYIPTDSGAAGTERLIYGQGGDVWYSPDHYETFVRIR